MASIRGYRREDYSRVRRILEGADLFDEVWEAEENLAGMVKVDEEAVLVAEVRGELVGVVFLIPYGSKVTYLFRLVVDEKWRGRGIGSELMLRAEKVARDRGVKEMGVYVDAKNDDLMGYYERRQYKSSKKPWVYMYKDVSKPEW
jgi:ribosomal protein S18 acetylase RimI-like enzyme